MKKVNSNSIFAILILLVSVFSVYGQNKHKLIEEIKVSTNDSIKVNLLINLIDELTYSDPEKALEYLNQTFELIRVSKKSLELELAKCYNREGIINTMQGKYFKAIENYQKALDIFIMLRKIDPDNQILHEGIVNIYGNIGTIYYHQKNCNEAIIYWKKSIQLLNFANYDIPRALLLNNIGVAYYDSNLNDSALFYYEKALTIFQNSDSQKNIAMCYTNIGDVYSEEGLYSKAVNFLQKSLEIKEKHEDNHGLSNCLISLSRLNYNMQNYDDSKKYADRAVEVCYHTENLKDLGDAYELLANNNKMMADFENAYYYHKKFKEINDSIFDKESNEKFIEMQSKYESEKKENELQLFRQKEKNQTLIRKVLIYGIIIIIIISFFIIRLVLIKRRNENKLYETNNKLKGKESDLMRRELEKKELITKRLNIEIDYKSKQLTTHALNMMQKNKILHALIKEIDDISKQAKPEVTSKLRKIKRIVNNNIRNEKDWDTFKLYFEQINQGFYDNLITITPSLNAHDLRHCALIKLNLNIKEVASVLNLSPNTVKSARYRIKKKLRLEPDDDLFEFIRDI